MRATNWTKCVVSGSRWYTNVAHPTSVVIVWCELEPGCDAPGQLVCVISLAVAATPRHGRPTLGFIERGERAAAPTADDTPAPGRKGEGCVAQFLAIRLHLHGLREVVAE